ncbi:hypothetical protein [Jiangella endophytica]|uniref:hypothetical protein n=1 Tax=Jiangella endophytica TaxID=1623398 RepID=UPI0013001AA7|nr:hypothetical protein [Jiangella endophytica]
MHLVAPLAAPPDRRSFAGREQCLAAVLVTLADIANGVADDPRGAITGGWWRPGDRPFDARVQEYSAILVWFLTRERPWNPYYRDEALRERTHAALDRYLELQHASGAWPEYAPEQHSRSATGFAIESLGSSLELLVAADELTVLHAPIAGAVRQAVDWYATPANTQVWWRDYTPIVNQPTGALAGALRFLDVAQGHQPLADPLDPERRRRVVERLTHLLCTGQSAAGFFHEPTGTDLGYSMTVMLPRLADLAARDDIPPIDGAVRRFVDWYARNAVLEPGEGVYMLNVAANARTSTPVTSVAADHTRFGARTASLSDSAPDLAAFVATRDDHDAMQRRWATSDEPIEPITTGTSTRLLDDAAADGYPSSTLQQAAQARLPYLSRDRWTELSHDARHQQFLFVRRPGYYLCATLGLRAGDRVRTGPGLLWHPELGAVVQGMNGPSRQVWTTLGPDGQEMADDDAFAQFFDGPPPNSPLLADPSAAVSQVGLRTHDGANVQQNDWVFDDHTITMTAYRSTALTQRIPVVLRGDQRLWVGDGAVHVDARSTGARFTIDFDGTDGNLSVSDGDDPYPGAVRRIVEFRQLRPEPLRVRYRLTGSGR